MGMFKLLGATLTKQCVLDPASMKMSFIMYVRIASFLLRDCRLFEVICSLTIKENNRDR